MPPWGPVKRVKLIRCLRAAGFDGPFSGGKHPFMSKGDVTIRIPIPHERDIGVELLSRLLRQAGLAWEEWEAL